jgi:hypothetical protein
MQKMINRLFNVQIELHKNFKKVVFLLSIFLFVACGAGGGSQGRLLNKIQANAESGDPHAQYLMGTYYFNGTKDSFGKQVIPQNKERAKEFFERAMSSGDKTAQKNVSQFLATEELSIQLNISNSMAQNFYVVYGVTNLKEYESAVAEIKSLGYPVKSVTSITPNEVIFFLEFKKLANQKNIALPKAVQDLKNQQDAKVAQQLAKEAETKRQAEQSRQKEVKASEIKSNKKTGNYSGYQAFVCTSDFNTGSIAQNLSLSLMNYLASENYQAFEKMIESSPRYLASSALGDKCVKHGFIRTTVPTGEKMLVNSNANESFYLYKTKGMGGFAFTGIIEKNP